MNQKEQNGERRLRLAVFDWAGTTVDYGSMMPVMVFDKVFRSAGIVLSRAEINEPMGKEKKEHIRELLSLPSASEQWQKAQQRSWTEADVEALYQQFEQVLSENVASRSKPLEGVAETISLLRGQGLKIGSTTGYTAEIMKQVLPVAAAGGYAPDFVVTPDVTGCGRPSPFMLYECMRQAGIYPPQAVVKVGDTITDIREGKNAGAWTVGLLTGSNLLGLDEEEAERIDGQTFAARREAARLRYLAAGADFVAERFTELPEIFSIIEERLQEGA